MPLSSHRQGLGPRDLGGRFRRQATDLVFIEARAAG